MSTHTGPLTQPVTQIPPPAAVRTRLFLVLTAASLALWLTVLGESRIPGLGGADRGNTWIWAWTLSGWLALVVTPLWAALAMSSWRPSQPLPTRFRRAAVRLMLAVFVVAALVTLVLGVVGWIGSERTLHPAPKAVKYDLSQFDLPAEEVRFPSRDGLVLAGWFIPGTDAATIILVHGYGQSRAELLPHADYLHRAGYSVLAFDLRNRGESEGDEVTAGVREPLDVEGAVDYVLSRPDVDHDRIGVQAISLGAASGIFAAAETAEIRAVVAESAFSSLRGVVDTNFEHFVGLPSFPFAPVTTFITERRLGTDADDIAPTKAIGRISPRPVFVIHGLEDHLIPADSGTALYEAAGEPKELWLIPGADHARAWEQVPDEYERRVLAFWEKILRAAEP